jgi:hypothetical protein
MAAYIPAFLRRKVTNKAFEIIWEPEWSGKLYGLEGPRVRFQASYT